MFRQRGPDGYQVRDGQFSHRVNHVDKMARITCSLLLTNNDDNFFGEFRSVPLPPLPQLSPFL